MLLDVNIGLILIIPVHRRHKRRRKAETRQETFIYSGFGLHQWTEILFAPPLNPEPNPLP
jgi:hypothetical protein